MTWPDITGSGGGYKDASSGGIRIQPALSKEIPNLQEDESARLDASTTWTSDSSTPTPSPQQLSVAFKALNPNKASSQGVWPYNPDTLIP